MNFFKNKKYKHQLHIIEFSYWPFCLSIFIFYLVFILINFFKKNNNVLFNHIFIVMFFLILVYWFIELIEESVFLGYTISLLQFNFLLNISLFIFTEIMFFFGFFWSYFHFSLNPSMEIGCLWPPVGIDVVNYKKLPLLNTFLLLSSGVSATYSHICLNNFNKNENLKYLIYTILLSFFFMRVQYIEFSNSNFTISDSVYGSSFFMITGLHGFHVLLGTFFLIISFIRIFSNLMNFNKSLFFDFSIYYWHFVDIVWLFVMSIIYIWGS